jgi:glucokinase
VADIGGSNARFGWVAAPGEALRDVRKLPVADHAGPAEAARAYLALCRDADAGPRTPLVRAALAVATAVDGEQVRFTNSHWCFTRASVQQALGLSALRLLNDFEALALALPHLGDHQRRCHGAAPGGTGTLAVVGPGTGLGVGAVVHTRSGWVALPGEGGHVTLPAADALEAEVIACARRQHGHVSAERLLSGLGLPTLHQSLGQATGRAPDEPWTAEAIVAAGTADTAGRDALARETLELFCAMLGGLAGNVALTLGARSGLYVGGGIVPRMPELFFASAFRQRFEAKGRFRDYLAGIPTALITDTLVALDGAAAALHPGAS